MATRKVPCGRCGRSVAPWKWTVYLRAHKTPAGGDWCSNGWISGTQPDTRSICFCERNPLGHTRREHEELWPLDFGPTADAD